MRIWSGVTAARWPRYCSERLRHRACFPSDVPPLGAPPGRELLDRRQASISGCCMARREPVLTATSTAKNRSYAPKEVPLGGSRAANVAQLPVRMRMERCAERTPTPCARCSICGRRKSGANWAQTGRSAGPTGNPAPQSGDAAPRAWAGNGSAKCPAGRRPYMATCSALPPSTISISRVALRKAAGRDASRACSGRASAWF